MNPFEKLMPFFGPKGRGVLRLFGVFVASVLIGVPADMLASSCLSTFRVVLSEEEEAAVPTGEEDEVDPLPVSVRSRLRHSKDIANHTIASLKALRSGSSLPLTHAYPRLLAFQGAGVCLRC